MTVTVAHPALAERLAAAHRYWVYADDDQERYWSIAASIGERAGVLTLPHAFESRVALARAGFVAWTERSMQGLEGDAWLTTPFYKNPHDNPLFLHFCWLLEINERLGQGADDLLVLTGSTGLAAAVDTLCRSRGIACRTAGFLRLRLERAARIARAGLALAAHACSLLWRMAVARRVLGSAYRRRLRDVDVMVDTYLMEQDLAADGSLVDRYQSGLLEYYARNQMTPASYPLLYRIPAARVAGVFRRMKASPTLFVPFELFATAGDVARALRRALGAAAARVPVAVADELPLDLRPIVEWHQPVTAMRALLPLVLLRAPARLDAAGIRPQRVIDWYENQPVDKACHIGFAAVAGDTQVIALRQYPPTPNWLSLYTTAAEVRAGVAPRENWVCGKIAAHAMAVYDDIGSYRVVPALRYAHLHDESDPPRPGNQLLLLLPYAQPDAHAVLRYVIPSLAALAASFEAVVVKPHHTVGRDARRQAAPDLDHALLQWSNAPVAELLSKARIVITGHTSAALEAVCSGKPVLVAGRTAGLTINVLDDADRRLWRVVYDARELQDGVRQWSPEHPLPFSERLAIGRALRDLYFEPANEKTMRAFLGTQETRP